MTILKLFPTPVYYVDEICSDKLNFFEQEIKKFENDTRRNGALNVKSSHRTNDKFHQNKVFEDLVSKIKLHLNIFIKEYGYPPQCINEIYISGMWFNISNKNDYLFPHNHPGSFLSGAYYVKSIPENHLIFSCANKNTVQEPLNMNELSCPMFPLQCKPGRLVIFHGDTTHATPAQESEGEKIVISFNTKLLNSN